MPKPKHIILTVTNDLNYDRRMIRICNSLVNAGYKVTLVGWKWPSSTALSQQSFIQKRLSIPIEKGKLMYILYWIKLFFWLLFQKADAICAIDFDTLLPVYFASKIKGTKRVFDAHEIFTEMQEVVSRPKVKRLWEKIGYFCVPKFPVGYTIGNAYADFYYNKYGVKYSVVRNATILRPFVIPDKKEKYILYQGAVNVGRCFEYLIPAMQKVNGQLIIIGNGNFYEQTQVLINQYNLHDKVQMLGYKRPEELLYYTENAWIGITLFDIDHEGKSNYYSMANRFFDYMHSGVPQLCMNYPEYASVNKQYEVAYLIDSYDEDTIAAALNKLLIDDEYHNKLSQNAMKAREQYCYQEEEKSLLSVYRNLFNS